MGHDLASRGDPPSADDAGLGALVRAVVDDWQRPPQRLGPTGWRDRVEVGRGRRHTTGGRRLIGRIAGAGMLAAAATVVLAVTAVYLTGPHADRGTAGSSLSPRPSPGASRGSGLPSALPP